jgi:hypothetical protein
MNWSFSLVWTPESDRCFPLSNDMEVLLGGEKMVQRQPYRHVLYYCESVIEWQSTYMKDTNLSKRFPCFGPRMWQMHDQVAAASSSGRVSALCHEPSCYNWWGRFKILDRFLLQLPQYVRVGML